jgi:hypothetical protein
MSDVILGDKILSETTAMTSADDDALADERGWRWFLLRQSPFLLLVVLALAVVAIASVDPDASFRYAQYLPPLFAVVIVAMSWTRVGQRGGSRAAPVARQVAHWAAVLAAIETVPLPVFGDAFSPSPRH